jgi:SAM-dependent methyltransferase
MQNPSKIDSAVRSSLRCPVCRGRVVPNEDGLTCDTPSCRSVFPIIDGIPILLNERNSAFAIADYRSQPESDGSGCLKTRLASLLPTLSSNPRAERNYSTLAEKLLQRPTPSRVLVIGGRILGQGMESLVESDQIELVESDVSFGPRTSIILDSHDIPFADQTFDGIIAQAVLEHVADPHRCVAEIHRVLKSDGLIYAETPFIQQVHGGPYDFTRFTHLGHRRLFRNFSEIESGAACGPGMALAWSYQYFLYSFVRTRMLRRMMTVVGRLTSFYLKYFDRYLIDKPGALDAASGYYFLGQKSDATLPDRELVRQYRGQVRT